MLVASAPFGKATKELLEDRPDSSLPGMERPKVGDTPRAPVSRISCPRDAPGGAQPAAPPLKAREDPGRRPQAVGGAEPLPRRQTPNHRSPPARQPGGPRPSTAPAPPPARGGARTRRPRSPGPSGCARARISKPGSGAEWACARAAFPTAPAPHPRRGPPSAAPT